MQLDLNKFRTLIPISALYEDNLLYLAEFSRRMQYPKGEVILEQNPQHPLAVYLMAGEIQLEDEEPVVLVSGSGSTLYPINDTETDAFHCEVVSETATFVLVDTHLLEKLLAWGELSPDTSITESYDISSGPNAEQSEWMMSMLRTGIFTRLPAANIQKLFERMEPLEAEEGDVIIRQGEPGDYFYVIREGRCKVTLPSESGEAILAELGPCSSFGEEALISDNVRNASVTMLNRGLLMRLSKQDFTELMEEPVMQWVDLNDIQPMLNRGAELIDVRFRSEFEKDALPFASNISVHRLRASIPSLDPKRTYIVYCDTGQRSAVAAFLLMQKGFDVRILRGGMRSQKDYSQSQ